jgi:hypothetical protein
MATTFETFFRWALDFFIIHYGLALLNLRQIVFVK